ncbi:MAG: hypothetical protein E6G37_12810 [Actinobacteria bacterium]|nr:MAG: hypothetical protein E6G37_12810 [Actinomycetota bacterium]
MAEGPWRRAGRGPRDDVRSRGPARAPSDAPDRRDRGCVPVRGRLHAVRRGRGCGGAQPAFVRSTHETRAPSSAPLVRVAEQPARRDRSGCRGDGDVRRCPPGARERPGDRSGGLRRVPAPSARRDPVGGPRSGDGDGPPTILGGGVRLGVDESPRLRHRSEGVHEEVGCAPVPAGASCGRGRDPILRGRSGPLDEATGARILELYGVRRPKEALVGTPAEAVEAARTIRSAVAVKAMAPELPHKAKLGGVHIDVRGAAAVAAAAEAVLVAARRAGARAPKVLVQQMIVGAEVLVGAVVDERFGACVTMRPGGALAEAGPAEFVAAPLGPKAARAYVQTHAGACGLDAAKHDLGAVAAAVAQIGRGAHDLRDRLVSLEANPLVVRDRGAVAVDALAEARAPA